MINHFKVFTIVFVLTELIFLYLTTIVGNGDFIEVLAKTALLSVIIYIYYLRHKWAKWLISVLLILMGVGSLLGSIDKSYFPLLINSILYFCLGFSLHISKELRAHPKKAIEPEGNALPELDLDPYTFKTTESETFEFPLLIKRYQSTLIDFLIIGVFLTLSTVLTDGYENGSGINRVVIFTLLLTYEPILTSYKMTLGQRITGIRVRSNENPNKKINIFQSYIRSITKIALGSLSIIVMFFNPRHRALHDYASSSVMIKAR